MKVKVFLKKLYKNYGHSLWILAYFAFYLIGFYALENAGHRHYHVIHSVIDDMIPFCRYFVVPYFVWFGFMAWGICWFIFKAENKRDYYKLVCALAIGMTIFLIVSCVFPNRQDLRPAVLTGNDIFTRWVRYLYSTDTPTNVLPSIHVYNTLILLYALYGCRQLKNRIRLKAVCTVIGILIILSTMFLKQHSVVDVSCGTLMSFAVQMLCDRVFGTGSETAPGAVYHSQD